MARLYLCWSFLIVVSIFSLNTGPRSEVELRAGGGREDERRGGEREEETTGTCVSQVKGFHGFNDGQSPRKAVV
jgi:hypothetical protein